MRVRKIARKTETQDQPRVKSLKIVGVVWVDAVFSHEEATPAPTKMFTVGFLVKSPRGQVSVAHEVGADGIFRGTTSIPKGMVKKIKPMGTISLTFDED